MQWSNLLGVSSNPTHEHLYRNHRVVYVFTYSLLLLLLFTFLFYLSTVSYFAGMRLLLLLLFFFFFFFKLFAIYVLNILEYLN